MAYFADSEPCSYFGSDKAPGLMAIGWLDDNHAYARGRIEIAFFHRLAELLVRPWQPIVFAGHEPCHFCRFTGGPSSVGFEGKEILVGGANLFVPGKNQTFVAPSTILHYVDSHDYCPPPEFQSAVVSCPDMRSLAYFKALRSSGPKWLSAFAGGSGS